MALLKNIDKTKCINALIVASLLFFAGVTTLLIILLVQNGMTAVYDDGFLKGDITLSTIILAGWIIFIVLIMVKTITIYSKVKEPLQ